MRDQPKDSYCEANGGRHSDALRAIGGEGDNLPSAYTKYFTQPWKRVFFPL